MSDTRDFPTATVASMTTGILLGKFSDMHEAAEFLMGHPIWTHHFASKDLWQKMQRAVLEQYPEMPTEAPGVNKENWREYAAELEKKFGPAVKIRKGSGATAMHPLEGIPEHLRDKTIVVDVSAPSAGKGHTDEH